MSIEITFFSKTKQTSINSLGMGVFDGVHLGHQQITTQVDTILTFNPHPATVIKNVTQLSRLSTPKEMSYYVNQVACLHFNKEIAAMRADEFLSEIILKKLNPKQIVVGYDYFFGTNRTGTPQYLQQWGIKHNINVIVVDPFSLNKTIVKSKFIRKLIQDNTLNEAISYLGHPYLIEGTVIKGDQRGKKLGFPTANIKVSETKLIPPKGVYSGYVILNNKSYKTFIYIGTKPTFNGQSNTIEAYIHEFSGNLYNQELAIHIEKFIRNEIKFNSSQDLIAQIKKDLGV